jgi:hypothetical protein
MIRIMFIGGHKHRTMAELHGSCMSAPQTYIEATIPEPPWRLNEMKQPYQARRPVRHRIETETYRLERFALGSHRMAYVYILAGWNPSPDQILSEPGVLRELQEIAF